MACTTLFNRTIIECARKAIKQRREYGKEAATEIFEAWITVGLAVLVDTIGWDATRNLLRNKMGELPPPRSKPKLVVYSNDKRIVPITENGTA